MKKGFIPEKCILWKKQNLEKSDVAMSNFDAVEILAESSHFWRYVLKCKECGQFYFFEFREEIDWSGGEDYQYCTWIPIPPGGQDVLKEKSSIELLDPELLPRIQSDFTPYRQVEAHWVGREKQKDASINLKDLQQNHQVEEIK